MTDSLKFAFNPKGWKVKTEYRSNNRMKFQLKLDKQEAEAFRNFANTVKPENINMRSLKDQDAPSIPRVTLRALTNHLLVALFKKQNNVQTCFSPNGESTK